MRVMVAMTTGVWTVSAAVNDVVAMGDAVENVTVSHFVSMIVLARYLFILHVEATVIDAVVAAAAIFVAASAAAAAGNDAARFETRSFGAVGLTNDLFLVHQSRINCDVFKD